MSGGVYTVKSDFPALEKKLQELGQLPTTVVSHAAGQGANVLRKEVRLQIPVRTGTMKRYIRRDRERSKLKGKMVYRVGMAGGEEANAALQRPVRNPGKYGGHSYGKGDAKHAYYPASTEYGWLGPNGKNEGSHWMLRASLASRAEADAAMLKTFESEVNKAWAKKRGEQIANGF